MARYAIVMGLLSALVGSTVQAQDKGSSSPMLSVKMVQIYTSLSSDERVDEAIAKFEKAAKAGYNNVLWIDSKWDKWDKVDKDYFERLAKVRETARRLNLKITALVAGVGYSNDLLMRDLNLAEGLPVVDAPFVVKDGKLVPKAESILVNGSFANNNGTAPKNWIVDAPGVIWFVDNDVKHDDSPSLRMQDPGVGDKHGRGRLIQKLKVKPFQYYHISMWVKSDGFAGKERLGISPMGKDGRVLQYERVRLEDKQDWTLLDRCFNTLDNDEVDLYIGTWSGGKGKVWIDDVRLEPAGLVNVLRREGTPVKVTSPDGKTVYTEGKDFAAIKDPMMGCDPDKAGGPPHLGKYKSWHEMPVVPIPAGSRLKEGDEVRISYYHPAVTAWEQVTCCMSDPKVMEIIKWTIENVHKHVKPDGYILGHDEIRAQGWDLTCERTKMTPPQILADNIKKCYAIVKKEDPGKPIYILNDPFDPNHNAHKEPYWLVKGPDGWYGSWEGLPKDAIILNWNGFDPVARVKTLEHFEKLGMRQVLSGFYDADPKKVIPWIKEAAKIKGVIGVEYATWTNDFSKLKEFLDAAESAVPATQKSK